VTSSWFFIRQVSTYLLKIIISTTEGNIKTAEVLYIGVGTRNWR